jgi:hypothetical protein
MECQGAVYNAKRWIAGERAQMDEKDIIYRQKF